MEPQPKPANEGLLVFLDMDGVLCDFITPAIQVHERNPIDVLNAWPRGEWDVCKILGLSVDQFWDRLRLSYSFWSDLPKTDWAWRLIRLCDELFGRNKTLFATSPSQCPSSYRGKAEWLARKGINVPARAMFGSQKHLLAAPGRILVDDNDTNCERWEAAGGTAILVPQVWNRRHADADAGHTWDVVRESLMDLAEGVTR